MGLVALLVIVAVTVIHGAMTVAWKRASLQIAKIVFGVPSIGMIPATERYRYAPLSLVLRHRVGLALLIFAAAFAWYLYGWLVAAVLLAGMAFLVELVASVFPGRSSPYYVRVMIIEYTERAVGLAAAGLHDDASALLKLREDLECRFGDPRPGPEARTIPDAP
jgi:hypothetical protein